MSRRTATSLREAIAADDSAAFQGAFLRELRKPLKRIFKKSAGSPLLALWSENTIELSGRERELAASLDALTSRVERSSSGKRSKRAPRLSVYEEVLADWLEESGGLPGPWETIVIAEILLREGNLLSADVFTSSLSLLADAMLRESITGLFEASERISDGDDTIRQIIGRGESPWLCSLLLNPLGGVQARQKSASEFLEKMLIESSDSDGIVHGSLLPRLPDWLAPLARCLFWADGFHQPLLSDEGRRRMTAVVEQSSMLVVPEFHHHADDEAPEPGGPSLRQLLQLLLPASDSPHALFLKKLLKACGQPAGRVPRWRKAKKQKPEKSRVAKSTSAKKTEKALPLSKQSDLSCVAILRSHAAADGDLLTLEWHSSEAQMNLVAAGVPLLAGHWDWAVWLDDQRVSLPSTWRCSCWFLDEDAVFVELEGEESSPVHRTRQMFLAPQNRFAMLTDSVVCDAGNHDVRLVTSIPLTEATLCTPDTMTREVVLARGPRTVRAFPLWLEDDRVQHAIGSCRQQDSRLELTGAGKGGVTIPLALDWNPRRGDAAADWTRLTVTESRRVVGSGEASGFRIRIGDQHVLLYRSLRRCTEPRAVLGLHTRDESAYFRIPKSTKALQSLVQVEPPEEASEAS